MVDFRLLPNNRRRTSVINHKQLVSAPTMRCPNLFVGLFGGLFGALSGGQSLRIIAASLLMVAMMTTNSTAQQASGLSNAGYHPLSRADMPPGVVGQNRLKQVGPVAGYYQPVVFKGPAGTRFALSEGGAIGEGQENLMAGLLIGSVYRFRVTQIPQAEGAELYPTVELIDRTYPPANLATSYPIPITIDEDDLNEALAGKMVTRVVYLEDPQTAIPLAQEPQTAGVMDVGEKDDVLRIADRFGRPVAIVRIGTVAPPTQHMLLPQFYFGYPSWAPIFQTEQ